MHIEGVCFVAAAVGGMDARPRQVFPRIVVHRTHATRTIYTAAGVPVFFVSFRRFVSFRCAPIRFVPFFRFVPLRCASILFVPTRSASLRSGVCFPSVSFRSVLFCFVSFRFVQFRLPSSVPWSVQLFRLVPSFHSVPFRSASLYRFGSFLKSLDFGPRSLPSVHPVHVQCPNPIRSVSFRISSMRETSVWHEARGRQTTATGRLEPRESAAYADFYL